MFDTAAGPGAAADATAWTAWVGAASADPAELRIGAIGDEAVLFVAAGMERVLARFAALQPGRDRDFAPDNVALELDWT
jgi:hypothetical protein